MAESEKSTQSKESGSSTSDSKTSKTTSGEATASTVDLDSDPRFNLSVGAKITTAEDAQMAFLRENITEEELRAVLARFGVTQITVPVDMHDSFQRSFPEDLMPPVPETAEGTTLEERQAMVEEEEKAKAEATAAAEAEAEKEGATTTEA